MSREGKLKHDINDLLDNLQYDFSSFSVSSFIEHLENITGKSFHFIPRRLLEHGAFGAWITSDHDELFFFEESTGPAHRIHIIMHEIGHLLCGHQTQYFPPNQVQRILHNGQFDLAGILRRHYTDEGDAVNEIEQQVEMLAMLLQERILQQNKLENLTSWNATDEITRYYLKSVGLY